MNLQSLVVIFFLCLGVNAQSQTWENLVLDENVAGLDENPIRGLIPGFPGIRNFPYSMEFVYLPLRNTMLGIDSLDWNDLEAKLEEISDEGNTAVVRFYMDYPTQTIATPQFLIDAGITMNLYSEHGNDSLNPNHSASPDYNDPITMSALLNFIDNFGLSYNGDPRISIVQAGLVGFWGEWHTYPLPINMSEPNKEMIFEAFINAFPNTEINIRQPQVGVPTNTEMMVGYHDDSFMQSTLGPETWHFWPTVISNGVSEVWKYHPIGGEIYPGLQNTVWDAIPNPQGQDFQTCVNTTHATYMLNHGIFDDSVGSITHMNALEQNKLFGYTFHVEAVKLNSFVDGNIDLDVRIKNNGVAPFYYNWDVELALFQNGTLTSLGMTDWNIDTIQPATFSENNFSSNQILDTGTYTILMRFVNPLTAIKPNAKQLRFTNAEQDLHEDGWISLNTLSYSTLGVSSSQELSDVLVYPTPTKTNAKIRVATESEWVEIEILDLQFRSVQSVFEGDLSQGEHNILMETGDLSAGEYIIQIKKESGLVHSKLVKVK